MWNCLLRPSRDQYDFAMADQMMNYAKRNNMQVIVEPLAWWNNLPAWAQQLSGDEAAKVLEEHIRTVVGRYASFGRPVIYSVINEAVAGGGSGYQQGFWYTKLGVDGDGVPRF